MTQPHFLMRQLLLVASICFATFARAEENRVALVIGNNAYKEGRLTAPINDARAMATALSALNFSVTRLEDAGRLRMLRAIRAFADQLGGNDTVAMFYFAGHGVQSHGKNYLLPIDADIEDEDDVELQGVDVQYLLDKFEGMKNPMNILILDACRNNPFTRRGLKSSGLAAVDGPPGTLVAFAAAPGHVAMERSGENGIYTKNVLAHISVPGLRIEDMFKRVRAGVVQETAAMQVPWENTSLVRDFYFRAAPAGKAPEVKIADVEAEAWKNVETSRNLYDFIGFLRTFPNSQHQVEVLTKVNAILERIKPRPPALISDELPALLNEAWAGLWFRPLTKAAAEFFGLEAPKGVLIVSVDRGSAAERGGLRAGDIILKVNGRPINNANEMLALNRTILPGEYAEAVVWRDRKEVLASAVVERVSLPMLLHRVAQDRVEKKDYERARRMYEYLASIDDAEAQSTLGIAYLNGIGVKRDPTAAEPLLLRASIQGKSAAAAALAALYLNPASAGKKDADAFRWAKFAADSGLPEGAALLGIAYLSGRGVPRNPSEGIRWSRLAAEQGQADAMFVLGVVNEKGVGVAPDLGEARKWYDRAAKLGQSDAKAALQRISP